MAIHISITKKRMNVCNLKYLGEKTTSKYDYNSETTNLFHLYIFNNNLYIHT